MRTNAHSHLDGCIIWRWKPLDFWHSSADRSNLINLKTTLIHHLHNKVLVHIIQFNYNSITSEEISNRRYFTLPEIARLVSAVEVFLKGLTIIDVIWGRDPWMSPIGQIIKYISIYWWKFGIETPYLAQPPGVDVLFCIYCWLWCL